jgi:2'-5' RNA ligase
VSGAQPPRRRLFFALWPDEAERRALVEAFGAVVAAAGGRAVAPANLHLTLEFLGPVAEAELPALAALGAALALPDEAVVLDRLDWLRRAAVLVAAPSAPAAGLAAAQADLRRALKGRGLRVDSRPFRPHVTLAREVTVAPRPCPASVAWSIRDLALVESVASPAGSRYTPLARWRRGAAPADFNAF